MLPFSNLILMLLECKKTVVIAETDAALVLAGREEV
jgi:hypothetical protein